MIDWKENRTWRNARVGLKSLMLHKLRSFLTVLGVVFGVASVIAMLSVGEGAGAQAMEQIRRLGAQNIIIDSVKPLDEERSGVRVGRMLDYGLRYEDAQRIAETFENIRRMVPVKILRQDGRLQTRKMELRLVGTTHEWFDLVRRPVLAGRVLSVEDMRRADNPVVLTEYGARRLLAGSHTIGEVLRIGGHHYEVVGIVQSADEDAGVSASDARVDAYIPIMTARHRYGDISVRIQAGSREIERVELHQLIIQLDKIEDVEPTAVGLEVMFGRFLPREDYRIQVPLALLRQAEATQRTFNIVLGSIAGISLLVGGIGIMNIMLASVTERTREIGIRRAIGARRRQIVGQFLVETMALSTIGGLIGLAIGVAVPRLITFFTGMPTIITPWSLVLALGISMGVGIIFGIYPAIRAARLDPIAALRHE